MAVSHGFHGPFARYKRVLLPDELRGKLVRRPDSVQLLQSSRSLMQTAPASASVVPSPDGLQHSLPIPQFRSPDGNMNASQTCSPVSQDIVIRRPRRETAAVVPAPPLEPREIAASPQRDVFTHARNAAGLTFAKRAVLFLSATGGVGLSALCALTSLTLHGKGMRTVLVDADFDAGGLDILLGLENDKGLRFGGLNAPLGRIDGEVLLHRLPSWEGVPVFAYDSWNSEIPEWWQVQAAIEALAQSADAVLIDAAHGRVLEMVPYLCLAPVVLAVELSVLGLARARTLLGRLSTPIAQSSADCVHAGNDGSLIAQGSSSVSFGPDSVVARSLNAVDCERLNHEGIGTETLRSRQLLAIVGIEPRNMSRRRGLVSIEDAETYLDHEIIGPLAVDNARASDALEGLGLKVGKSDRTVLDKLVRLIAERDEGGERH